MYSPQILEDGSALPPLLPPQDPRTEATAGQTTSTARPAHASATSMEMENRRFNETAPLVVSPTSSSTRQVVSAMAGDPSYPATNSTPSVAGGSGGTTSSSPTSFAQLSGGVRLSQQQPSRRHTKLPHAARSRTQDATSLARRASHNGESGPSQASSLTPHKQHTRKQRRSSHDGGQKKRTHKQEFDARHAKMKRPLAAAPRFGHPFASNPDLPHLSTYSSAAARSTAAYGSRNTSMEAAHSRDVTAANLSMSGADGVGDGGNGEASLTVATPPANRLLPRRLSSRFDSEIPETTGGNDHEMELPSRNTQAASPRPLKAPHQPPPASSGALDDAEEEPLFSQREGRHLRYPGEHPAHHKHLPRRGSGTSRGTARSSYSEKSGRNRGGRRYHHRGTEAAEAGYGTGEEPRNEEHLSYSAQSQSHSPDDSGATHVTRDSFGYPVYHPVFRHVTFGEYDDVSCGGNNTRNGDVGSRQALNYPGGRRGVGSPDAAPVAVEVPTTTDVPWDLRNVTEKEINSTFAFLSNRYFWFLIEYSLRVTCIAMLVPAVIINLDLTYTPFLSTTFALTSVVIAVGTNFGQSCVFFVQYVKGGCIWLPLATICSALHLNRYLGAWFVVYVVLLFLMAMFTEKTTRRMCLLLYNISMCSLLSGDESLVFPTRVLADWALGAAFALVATLIPYPILATRFSAHITKVMFNNTATCFTGILSCFWAPSNTERSMSMVRIRALVRTLDHLIEKFDSYDAFTFYEVLIYETSEKREVRKEKVKLLLKLKMNLRAMERVINMVQDKPQIIDLSERCLLLRDHLSLPMDDISRSMEALLWKLSAAKQYEQLRTLGSYFEAAGRAMKRLQTEFDVGRRVLFYEHQEASMLHDGRMEEFVPLMTFFVFSIVNFWTTLEEFETFINRHEPTSDWKESFKLVWNALVDPFVENAELLRLLCVRRGEPELRVVVEAAKVSTAMLISVIFFYYVDNQSLLLTGPSIIAFVSGTNPVEAVQAGAARMSGTLIGAVLGFFAASLCRTAVDRVAALCVITFAMTFFRPGQKFGTVCMYCNFVAVSSLAPTEQTADMTISRIQQNTFAIFIYCFISVAVFPVNPSDVLLKKRMAVIQSLSGTVQKLSSLFNEAARSYIEVRSEILRGAKTEDGVVSISRSDTVLALEPLRLHTSSPNNNNNNSMFGKLKGALSSDLATLAARNTSNMLMPGTFTMAPQDTLLEKIFVDIFAMMDTMKATSSIMPLAADEFQIIPHEYPLRASGDVHSALYRLCALVYTMTCAWKTMREKGYFTTDMLHILHNLAPIANDIARCIDRFSHVMEFYMRSPSSGVSSELTKGAMQFRALCVELSARKERDLIAVIRHTILMKRIRNDSSAEDEEDEDGEEEASISGGNGVGGSNNGGNSGGEGIGRHQARQRRYSNINDNGNRHRRSSRDAGHRRGSHLLPGQHRAALGNTGKQRRYRARGGSSSSSAHYPNQREPHDELGAAVGKPGSGGEKDAFNALQVRSAVPFFTSTVPAAAAVPCCQAASSSSDTFKDSVMPRVDSREDAPPPRFSPPIPGSSAWLPVPRSEVPEMPTHGMQQEQDLNSYQHVYEQDDESGAGTSPRSRENLGGGDGGGEVTNTTRVFDASVFPPPPLDEEQAAAVRRARQKAQLLPSMKGGSVGDRGASLPPQQQPRSYSPSTPSLSATTTAGGAVSEPHQRQHSAMVDGDHAHSHHSHLSRSTQHPSRIVAHEEYPAVRKKSALLRANRLREHLRGFQRQPLTAQMSRQHSSFEMCTFGASYTNIAGTEKDGRGGVSTAHHRGHHPRYRSHHVSPHQRNPHGRSYSSLYYEEEEEETGKGERWAEGDPLHSRSSRRSYSSPTGHPPGFRTALPYGSREGDIAQLAAPQRQEEAHEPTAPSQQQQQQQQARHAASRGTNYRSQDRITLNQSSSDGAEEESRSGSGASSSYSSGSSSYSEGDSGRSERGDSGSYDDDDGDAPSTLVRFKDSFTTPITVQDAEGLHAYTLSLEMFGKELRRVLYGMEEMLQSI